MTKHALKIYAAPVALLLMAGGLATQSASADPGREHRKVVSGRFVYERAAPAGQIVHDLERFAKRLCRISQTGPIALQSVDERCVAEAMQDAISKIGRIDVASLHEQIQDRTS